MGLNEMNAEKIKLEIEQKLKKSLSKYLGKTSPKKIKKELKNVVDKEYLEIKNKNYIKDFSVKSVKSLWEKWNIIVKIKWFFYVFLGFGKSKMITYFSFKYRLSEIFENKIIDLLPTANTSEDANDEKIKLLEEMHQKLAKEFDKKYFKEWMVYSPKKNIFIIDSVIKSSKPLDYLNISIKLNEVDNK